MTDFQELKRLAEAATPGPWGISRNGSTITSNQSHPIAILSDPFHRQCEHGVGQDAEFISAANPQTILELIGRLERAEAELKEYRQPRPAPAPHSTDDYNLST